MGGTAGLFTFPFRIYGEEGIPDVEIESEAAKVRVHSPSKLRENGPVISPDYPSSEWPAFYWSKWLGRKKRRFPPKINANPSLGGSWYDGFRVDYWTDGSPERGLREFVRLFLAWLRLRSGQDWIGRYEIHTDVYMKYGFELDKVGHAAETPYAYAVSRLRPPWARAVDADLWESCVESAIGEEAVPEYWVLFLDAGVSRVEDDLRGAVLRLALSLEIARNTCFPSFAEVEEDPLLGPRLASPFDGTDLLKHLSKALAAVHPDSLNCAEELPDAWPHIKRLYIARHHVAHGKPPVSKFDDGMRALTDSDLQDFAEAVLDTLLWIERISQSS